MREGAELRRARIKKRFAPCKIEMAVGRFKANPEPQSLSSCVSYEHADDLVGPVFLGCADLPRFRFATFALVEFVNEIDPPFWQRFIDDGVMALAQSRGQTRFHGALFHSGPHTSPHVSGRESLDAPIKNQTVLKRELSLQITPAAPSDTSEVDTRPALHTDRSRPNRLFMCR